MLEKREKLKHPCEKLSRVTTATTSKTWPRAPAFTIAGHSSIQPVTSKHYRVPGWIAL